MQGFSETPLSVCSQPVLNTLQRRTLLCSWEHRIHDDFVPVRVVTRNNLNSIIYRPRMFGRDPEDEIKASWIEGVLSEVSEFLKFWPGEIIPARRDGEWEP